MIICFLPMEADRHWVALSGHNFAKPLFILHLATSRRLGTAIRYHSRYLESTKFNSVLEHFLQFNLDDHMKSFPTHALIFTHACACAIQSPTTSFSFREAIPS